jgi:hypothetical protein
VWGISGTDVFVVGNDGATVHYDGSSWTNMSSGTTEWLADVWGSSRTDVFAVGDLGATVHYDGIAWAVMSVEGSLGSTVTDLDFHNENSDIIYAATWEAGVYISPNQGVKWLNLGTPEHSVFAISTGSLYAATKGGLLQCTGTGVIAGRVRDQPTGIGIDNATVITDFGVTCKSVNGDYMMVSPAGIFDVTSVADAHANTTIKNVVVLGGDVTVPQDLAMPTGEPDWSALGDDTSRGSGGGGGCFVSTAAVDLIWPNTLRFLMNLQSIPYCHMRSAKDTLHDLAGLKSPPECTWIPIHGQRVRQCPLCIGKLNFQGMGTEKRVCLEEVP